MAEHGSTSGKNRVSDHETPLKPPQNGQNQAKKQKKH